MKRFASLLAVLSILTAAPAFASASGRAIETGLAGVSASGGGLDWVFYVTYLNMGGSCGTSYQVGVIVHTSTDFGLPSTVARADAYEDFGNDHTNGLTCASNTMQLLTPVTLLVYTDL